MKPWMVLLVLVLLVACVARPPPTHAISTLDISPSSVSTGGTVTITLTHILGASSDVFTSVTVTDPLGNVFTFNNHHLVVSSSVVLQFPDPGKWTFTSGPGGNTGTDISGGYSVAGQYLDLTLTQLLGHFVVLTDHGQFNVPEFGQSLMAAVAMSLPVLLLARRRNLRQNS